MLKLTSQTSSKFLELIFNQALRTAETPDDWKCANIKPIFKDGNKRDFTNYRPISLTSTVCKMLEHIILSNLFPFLLDKNILSPQQFGFRSGSSTELLLVNLVNKITSGMESHGQLTWCQ